MSNHRVKYPGLDRFYCDLCGNWVCQDWEINRLEGVLNNLKGKKAKEKLWLEINKEKRLIKECKKQ